MTTLLAIDPGKDTGWARFVDGQLQACGLASVEQPPEVFGDELVIEMPVIYPKSPVPPNDILKVAVEVGQFVRMARDSLMQYRLVAPRTWKGTVPKQIHNQRVTAALSSDELVVLAEALKGAAKSKHHNAVDACGLGLWALGRLAR